jgi:hypothetical protein
MGYLNVGNEEKIAALASVEQVFCGVGDLAGVRVATYVESDRERVVDLIRHHFHESLTGLPVEVDRKSRDSGYRATHCQVALPERLIAGPDGRNLRGLTCEIQVCSMLAHAWNEIEHDIRYKVGRLGEVSPFEGILLDNFLEKTLEGDELIGQILSERATRLAITMLSSVASMFPQTSRFAANAQEVLREAVRLGYDSPERVQEALLSDPDFLSVAREQVAVYNTVLEAQGQVARLDSDTADVLLALLLSHHAADIRALHFRDLSSGQALRVARIADAIAAASEQDRHVEVAGPRQR